MAQIQSQFGGKPVASQFGGRPLSPTQSLAITDAADNKLSTGNTPLGVNMGGDAYANNLGGQLPEFATQAGNNALFGGEMGGDEQKWNVFKDAVAGLVTYNPKARIDGIEKRFPGLHVHRYGPNDEKAIFTDPATGKQAVLNKEGISMMDVAPIMGGMLASTPAGRFAAGGVGVASKIGRGIIGEVATDVALQGAEQVQGSDQPYDLGRTTIAGGLGGVMGGGIALGQNYLGKRVAAKNALLSGTESADAAGYQVGRKITQPASLIDGISKSKAGRQAVKQTLEPENVSLIRAGTPEEKGYMRQMMDIFEEGRGRKMYAAKNRPDKIIGDVVLKEFKFLRNQQQQAGKKLTKAVAGLRGESVDMTHPTSVFDDMLAKLDIGITDEGLDFTNSVIQGNPAESRIKEVFKFMENNSDDAYQLHNLKRYIDKRVSWGESAGLSEGAMDKTAETLLKGFRKSLGDALGAVSDDYKTANGIYSSTSDALGEVYTAMGKNFDPTKPFANEEIGIVARSVLSNNRGRGKVIRAFTENQAARDLGYKGDYDLVRMIEFSDILEARFGSFAPKSFMGQIEKANNLNTDKLIDAGSTAFASQTGIPLPPAGLIKSGVRSMRGVNEDNLIKSIRGLLEDAPKKSNSLSR